MHRSTTSALARALGVAFTLLLVGCGEQRAGTETPHVMADGGRLAAAQPRGPSAAAPHGGAGAQPFRGVAPTGRDARDPRAADQGGDVVDPASDRTILVGAMYMATPIMSDMEWPDRNRARATRSGRGRDPDKDGIMRLGYVRQGGRFSVFPEVHRKANCAEGWYELVAGGFVCGRYATPDLNHPRVRTGPHVADLASALPYVYGVNNRNGTPLYFAVPTPEDRVRFEPWFQGQGGAARTKIRPAREVEPTTDNPYVDPAELAGGPRVTEPPGEGAGASPDEPDAGVPWYLQKVESGKPQVTLDELRGDTGGPIVRRMVKGFFVALDSEVKVKNVKWWKTTFGHVVSHDRIWLQTPKSEFHGAWLNKPDPPPFPSPLTAPAAPDPTTGVLFASGGAPAARPSTPPLPAEPSIATAASHDDAPPSGTPIVAGSALGALQPPGPPAASAPASPPLQPPGVSAAAPVAPAVSVAFVTSSHAVRYRLSTDGKSLARGEPMERRTAVALTGRTIKVGGQAFDEVTDGTWMRAGDGMKVKPGPAPKDLQPGEKWIDVNLTNQSLVAFEGDVPVFATLVSSGKKNDADREQDHRTPTGTFRIREKHVSATMDGDVASDGPYSIEDVPWIMYFQGSYALHGAFWHAAFGHERSHGCVNLSPADARALFMWTDPPLPDGWHGVAATQSRPGTRVVVHDEAPPPAWAGAAQAARFELVR
jgi:lipoprotein-anchoring transpeptidase ErfK/SrfK